MEEGTTNSPNAGPSILGPFAAFALDTVIVYFCALRVSGTLVSRWFAWVAPLLQIPTTTRSADWYLQHLEWVTMIPALAAGYLNVSRFVPAVFGRRIAAVCFTTAAVWARVLPPLVLVFKILLFRAPTSVLGCSSMSPLVI